MERKLHERGVVGVEPEVMENIFQYIGEALCTILTLLPSSKFSVTWDVSEDCHIKLIISKE